MLCFGGSSAKQEGGQQRERKQEAPQAQDRVQPPLSETRALQGERQSQVTQLAFPKDPSGGCEDSRLQGAEVEVGRLVRGLPGGRWPGSGEAIGGGEQSGGQVLGAPSWDVRGRDDMALASGLEGWSCPLLPGEPEQVHRDQELRLRSPQHTQVEQQGLGSGKGV